MATYEGIFVRSELNEHNTIPRRGAVSNSPDIIPYGISPVESPEYFRDTYDEDVSKPLLPGISNYIYLRGKNYSNFGIDDYGDTRPRLYRTQRCLLSYPGQWAEINETQDEQLNAPSGDVGVSTAFYWVPQNPAEAVSSLVAQVPSPGYDNSIPNTTKVSDFARWMENCGGIAMRNVTFVKTNVVSLSNEAMAYNQGAEAATISFVIRCTNIPLGSTLLLSSDEPGPNLKLTVSTFPSYSSGENCSLPAGYQSNINLSLQTPAGTETLNGATISITTQFNDDQQGRTVIVGQTNFEWKDN